MIKNNRLNQNLLCWTTALAFTAIAGFNTVALAQGGDDEGYQSNEKSGIYENASSEYDGPLSGDEGYQSNEKSGIYGDAPSGLNPLDIIHRAQQTNGRSAAEFDQESQAQIDNSALDFKRLQQQRILEQQQLQQSAAKEQVNPPATIP